MSKYVGQSNYPPEVEELAFSCYVQADRNVARTHRMLAEFCTPDDPIPDRSTISRWAKANSWDVRADELISEQFPNLLRRDLARLQVLRSQALAEQAAIFAGERDHLPTAAMQARSTGIATVLQISGLGTAGARTETSAIAPSRPVEALPEGTSVADLVRMQRERLEAER